MQSEDPVGNVDHARPSSVEFRLLQRLQGSSGSKRYQAEAIIVERVRVAWSQLYEPRENVRCSLRLALLQERNRGMNEVRSIQAGSEEPTTALACLASQRKIRNQARISRALLKDLP